jgi:hypothetical protein
MYTIVTRVSLVFLSTSKKVPEYYLDFATTASFQILSNSALANRTDSVVNNPQEDARGHAEQQVFMVLCVSVLHRHDTGLDDKRH